MGFTGTLTFSGSALPVPFFVTGNFFRVRFESNSNGTVGRDFRLRWRAVFIENSSPTTPATAFGNALQFDARKGALLGGYLETGTVSAAGEYSTALGASNMAGGFISTALGLENTASGNVSTALGYGVSTNGQSGGFIIGDTDPLFQGLTGIGIPDQFVARFRTWLLPDDLWEPQSHGCSDRGWSKRLGHYLRFD